MGKSTSMMATLAVISFLCVLSVSNAFKSAMFPPAYNELMQRENADGHEIVRCDFDSKYSLYIQVRRDWAPLGAQRFIELVNDEILNECALFRGIDNFLVQFGLGSTAEKREKYGHSDAAIMDDPSKNIPFTKGIISFAGAGPNTRDQQIFITLGESVPHLGQAPWEVPVAKIIHGMEHLQYIETKYADEPNQQMIWSQGYEYLRDNFPDLSYIDKCKVIPAKKQEL